MCFHSLQKRESYLTYLVYNGVSQESQHNEWAGNTVHSRPGRGSSRLLVAAASAHKHIQLYSAGLGLQLECKSIRDGVKGDSLDMLPAHSHHL